MEEKIVLLDESDLDNVVGGAYNQGTISKLGLAIQTGKSGAQGIYVDMQYSSTQGSQVSAGSRQGWASDASLRNIVQNYDNVSVSVKTTSGEMKSLSKDELSQLLS